MAIAKTEIGSTFYLKKGKNVKTPIISCHGGPGGTHNSIKKLLELEADRTVVVYDQIGSGKSSEIKQDKWKIETFCQQLDELATNLGFEKFILHGSSWGGTLILEYYKRYPNKVKGLIFHSSLISTKKWEEDAKRLIKKLPKKTREVIECCEKVGATDSKVYKEAMMVYYKRHCCRDPKAYDPTIKKPKVNFNEALYNYMWGPSEFCATGTLKKYDGTKTLSKIKVPTLFICGKYDEATPESAKYFSKKVKGSVVKIIAGASHSSLREKPEQTLSAINGFLKKALL